MLAGPDLSTVTSSQSALSEQDLIKYLFIILGFLILLLLLIYLLIRLRKLYISNHYRQSTVQVAVDGPEGQQQPGGSSLVSQVINIHVDSC